MEPAIGSVFAERVDRFGRYALRQFCGEADGQRWWLDLDWFEPDLPTDLAALQPLQQYREGYDGQPYYFRCGAATPTRWELLGVSEPLRSERPWMFDLELREPVAADEYEWLQHPQSERDAYKNAYASGEVVEVGGEEVKRRESRLPARLMSAPADELAQLVCVSWVEIAHDRPDLEQVLAGFPFLRDVMVSGPVEKLVLPPHVSGLWLWSGAPAGIEVTRGTVTRPHADALIEPPDVTRLHVSGFAELDVADLTERYPHLHLLGLRGSPGTLTGLNALAEWPDLRTLYLTDVFGFETFPHLPTLEYLDAESIPKSAGVQARKDYAAINPRVTKLRTDAWLADNLGNPFRSWDGAEHVPARHAKSAWTAYKKHRKTLRAAAAQAAAGESSAESFATVVIDTITTAAQEFNRWDKSGWIETGEREHIAQTYHELLNEVSETYPVDLDAAMTALDAARDW